MSIMRSPLSRFSYVNSDVDVKRSRFSRPFRHLTTMSAGLLYPLMVDEVLPGDTYTVDTSVLARMSTPIHPVMDNCFLDLYYFYVPQRLCWTHFKEFMGESPSVPYVNPVEYSQPMFICSDPHLQTYGVAPKSVLDYMGIPAGTVVKEFEQNPVRGFCLIWNEWFRDQNLQNAIDVRLDDQNRVYFKSPNPPDYDTDPDAYVFSTSLGGHLPPVNKYHDYFTSALIQAQKGDPVPIPLSGFAPVYGNELIDIGNSLNLSSHHQNTILNGDSDIPLNGSTLVVDGDGGLSSLKNGEGLGFDERAYFNNLGADLSNLAGVYATITDLRYAFQLQKFLERENLGGSRYRETLLAHFGVTSPDATQQVPEFLGGKRIPINISQVLQTSSTDETSPQGNTAAYSLTTDVSSAFTKSFTEHGFIYCVGCIRTEHTYQNSVEKFWFKKDRFDYYFPEFSNISEQPIYNREIYNYMPGKSLDQDYDSSTPDEVFGFQEAWAEYRYKPNRVSGEFRSTYNGSLDVWHYADDYLEQPRLSSGWIRETRANIDRTLAVDSTVSDQFICDFYFDMKATRVMPVTSTPGLADHH